MTAAGTAFPVPAPPRRWSTLGPSLQRRVSRFTLLIVAVAVLVTSLGAYEATRMSVYRTVDDALESTSSASLRSLGPSPDPSTVARFLASSVDLDHDAVVAVVRADGQVSSSVGPVTLGVDGRDLAVAAGQGVATTHTARASTGATYRVRVTPIGPEPGAASRATPGTGLGLSITESVVRQHGGTVAVLDATGGGALFLLTFPMATMRPSAAAATGR